MGRVLVRDGDFDDLNPDDQRQKWANKDTLHGSALSITNYYELPMF